MKQEIEITLEDIENEELVQIPKRKSILTGKYLKKPKKSYRIAMITDFFYPSVGGVETHIFQLSQCLIKRGHKVIVITHQYGDRNGIRFMTNGLKVYYIPKLRAPDKSSFPTVWNNTPILRDIFLRERIMIVHGHQEISVLAHEGVLNARELGIKAVFTEHSLFGFNEIHYILVNKGLMYSLLDGVHLICVSNTTKENAVLRTALSPYLVSVIPNATDFSRFTPDPTQSDPNWITIVSITRLMYRKGVDLMVDLIPIVCRAVPNVRFIIGGDGPKRVFIEMMIEKYDLQDRVKLLGFVKHENVPKVLVQGNIFLNTSLTESFCIAILEAVSCGLYVVATKVGGVPEVLPNYMISFAKPNPEELAQKLIEATEKCKDVDPYFFHKEVREMYDWHDIAERTEKVYDDMMLQPERPLFEKLRYHSRGGTWGALLNKLIFMLRLIWLFILEVCFPREQIHYAVDFPTDKFLKMKKKKLNN
ncbi:n-acetylglucosaminyl-phosphatidylinositol biosynthetic protein [Anaeramoeba flamelloides]|uniref:phosphatidylinositol N-acetylglucosaminyltransferase n=1 Tax=Anaeramoeba flamelloides TaxID=1746091 RepID=A0AAV7YAC3_9EUKA|nr:n-acetylglucosaminyl-phosphatidylinositol biosynthetic protein [Anaeramoeba flamelloides]KAJ6234306.1 n-acetylglucosaminyl-phosphatidylinositol biosynthetic protein [Anaeramoeba flamelloides]